MTDNQPQRNKNKFFFKNMLIPAKTWLDSQTFLGVWPSENTCNIYLYICFFFSVVSAYCICYTLYIVVKYLLKRKNDSYTVVCLALEWSEELTCWLLLQPTLKTSPLSCALHFTGLKSASKSSRPWCVKWCNGSWKINSCSVTRGWFQIRLLLRRHFQTLNCSHTQLL